LIQKTLFFKWNLTLPIDDKVEVDFKKRFELEKLNDLNNLTLKDVQEYTNFTKDYLKRKIKKSLKK
jgi:hypothetical protein